MSRSALPTPVARLADVFQAVRGDGRGWILLVVAAGWLVVQGMRFVIPTLLPQIKATFAIDNATAGAAITLLWVVYAGMQFPAGLAIDRTGERLMLVGSMLVGAVCAAAFLLMPSYAVFVAACALFGFGTGLYGPTRGTLLSSVFPENDGTALGVTWAAGSVGAAAFPFVAGVVALAFGWRSAFAVPLPLFALAAVGMWAVVPDRTPDAGGGSGDSPARLLGGIAAGLRRRRILLAGGAFTVLSFIFQGLTAFLPTYLVAVKGVSPGTTAVLYGLFFATSAAVQPLAGRVADLYGDRLTLTVVTAFSAVVLLALPFATGVASLAVLATLLGTRGGVAPITNAYLVAGIAEEVQGAGYGLLRTVYMGVGAGGPVVVGTLADASLFDEAFLLLAALTGLATGLYALLPRDGAAA